MLDAVRGRSIQCAAGIHHNGFDGAQPGCLTIAQNKRGLKIFAFLRSEGARARPVDPLNIFSGETLWLIAILLLSRNFLASLSKA